MPAINEIPTAVLDKIKEYAFKQYNVTNVTELKAAIVDEKFEQIVNEYLDEATLRIKRQKQDEYNAYIPTEDEIIAKLQEKIDATQVITMQTGNLKLEHEITLKESTTPTALAD